MWSALGPKASSRFSARFALALGDELRRIGPERGRGFVVSSGFFRLEGLPLRRGVRRRGIEYQPYPFRYMV